MMASRRRHDALWAKLHELEVQLAAYKLLRAARGWGGEDAGAPGCGVGAAGTAPGGAACRGRQYDAYMRRRDARRVSAEQQQAAKARATRAVRCAARDAHEGRRGAAEE